MYSIVYSAAAVGVGSFLLRVETDSSPGLPCFEMVGLLSSEVREARERVRVALHNCGFSVPSTHITVNLSPADMRKEGAAFDLPIAVGLLTGFGVLPEGASNGYIVIGELGLGGEIKPVRGILPIVRECLKQGFHRFMIPYENAAEGACFREALITPVRTLPEAVEYLKTEEKKRDQLIPPFRSVQEEGSPQKLPDFAEVIGQPGARRACEIAAAGFHHLLMVGPPGTGKSMMAKRIPGILPPLDEEDSLEVSGIYSVAGCLKDGKLMKYRPFVSPHHTTSPHALAGGGHVPRPGAITLAHRGVLFLDEIPEFGRNCIETLRQPLEDKKVCIQRTSGNYVFPADFMLVAAMNPCPCGFYPDRNRCSCSPDMIRRYLARLSGPILDRIDLCTNVDMVDITKANGRTHHESSEEILNRVMAARRRQEERYKGTGIRFNADLGPGEISTYCSLGAEEQEYMNRIYSKLNLSLRGYHRILKVARTIADLHGSEEIRREDLSGAVSYRPGEILR